MARATKAEIDALSHAGFEYYQSGRHKEAVQQYSNIIRLRPNYAYFQRGINHFKLGRYSEAVMDCQAAANIVNNNHPNNIPDFINVIEQYYDEYSSLWFELDFVYIVLGHALFALKKYRQAINAWEHSIELHPINEFDLREKLEEARNKC